MKFFWSRDPGANTSADDNANETCGLLSYEPNTGSEGTISYDSVERQQTQRPALHKWIVACMLSTAFAYGCILTTLFLITLPVECERIQQSHPKCPKSVALGVFVAIAGVTQLISPLIGHMSDVYRPQVALQVGQRLPYFVLGAFCSAGGLLGQMISSSTGFWLRYGLSFFLHMIGLNIQYAMMLALLADHVPDEQVGVANGILALLLVSGSLFGFGLFHSILSEDVHSMYGLYTCIVIVTSILTGTHCQDMDVELTLSRILPPESSDLFLDQASDERSATLQPDSERSLRSNTSASIPSGPRWHRAARKAARRAQKAALNAHKTIIVNPSQLVVSLSEPLFTMDRKTLLNSYTIDVAKNHDFFIVTVSRLFYYCGMSVQTFFLYFLKDIIHVKENPEAAVAFLAIMGQVCGATTCYPVGLFSDLALGGQRKPFVYFACTVLSAATFLMMFAQDLDDMIALCCILGGANGVYLTMETSLAVDTLPGHHSSDSENSDDAGNAQLLGIWGVAAFLGSALGPMIGGPLLYLFGKTEASTRGNTEYSSEDEEEYSLAGYVVVLSLSSFYFICSALALRFLRHGR